MKVALKVLIPVVLSLTSINAFASIDSFWKALEARAASHCSANDYDLMRRALENRNVRMIEEQPGAGLRLKGVLGQSRGVSCVNVVVEEAMDINPDEAYAGYRITTSRLVYNVIVVFSELDGKMVGIEVSEATPSNVTPLYRK